MPAQPVGTAASPVPALEVPSGVGGQWATITVTKARVRVVNRPGGTYFVEVRRKGVEGFSGLLPFDAISALQWFRWRLSRKRLWVVEVQAPLSRRRRNRSKRLVFSQDFGSKAEALAAMGPTAARLEAGHFDQPLA